MIDRSFVWHILQNSMLRLQAGDEASAGSSAAQGSSAGEDKGFTMHILAEGGASATATARVIRVKVNKDLTAGR